MDLEDIMLNEISQTEEDRSFVFSLVCGIYDSQTQRQSRMVVTRAWDGGGGGEVMVRGNMASAMQDLRSNTQHSAYC